MFNQDNVTVIAIVLAVTAIMVRVVSDILRERRARKAVANAESKAFEQLSELPSEMTDLLSADGTYDKSRFDQIARLLQDSRTAVSMGSLSNLYSKQILEYQQQTRSRANWSFIFAIIAMSAGLGFVFWGGVVMISGGNQTLQLAAGGAVSTIGGTVSAYIVKTFLDVHRLSLEQMNRYFQQPVINDHILMAQRLADAVGDEDSRKKGYEQIIESVTKLITEVSGESAASP